MANTKNFKGGRKTILLGNVEVVEKLKMIMTLPEYKKSFNKAVNEAIYRGVDDMMKEFFGIQEDNENEQAPTEQREKSQAELARAAEMDLKEQKIEDDMDKIVTLMTEDVAYLTMIKSIVSSLFNAEAAKINGTILPKEKFEEGLYRSTPLYLQNYETRIMRRIRK